MPTPNCFDPYQRHQCDLVRFSSRIECLLFGLLSSDMHSALTPCSPPSSSQSAGWLWWIWAIIYRFVLTAGSDFKYMQMREQFDSVWENSFVQWMVCIPVCEHTHRHSATLNSPFTCKMANFGTIIVCYIVSFVYYSTHKSFPSIDYSACTKQMCHYISPYSVFDWIFCQHVLRIYANQIFSIYCNVWL